MFNSYLLAGSSRNCLSRANPANRYSRTDEIWQYLKVFLMSLREKMTFACVESSMQRGVSRVRTSILTGT
jgi:hypothetical protein